MAQAMNAYPWETGFRRQMVARRKALEISQTELATTLRNKGLPFHQQTVQRVESGERSVRLDEAFIIADCLDSSVEEMVAPLNEALDAVVMVDRLRRSSETVSYDLFENWREWAESFNLLAYTFETQLESETAEQQPSRLITWIAAWIVKGREIDSQLRVLAEHLADATQNNGILQHQTPSTLNYAWVRDNHPRFNSLPKDERPEQLARLSPFDLQVYLTGDANTPMGDSAFRREPGVGYSLEPEIGPDNES